MTLILTRLLAASNSLASRVRVDSGQTMAEYAILIAVIALIVLVVALTLGSSIAAVVSSTARKV